MIRLSFILLSLLTSFICDAQIKSKQDYVWILNNDFAHDGMQAYVFDYNDFDSVPVPLNEYTPIAFSGNNASICDKDGNLLLYSNGCFVADSTHSILTNSIGINEGEFIEIYRNGDCSNGYPGIQDILMLPDASNDNGVYLIHKRIELENDFSPSHKDILYSYIEKINDRYSVIEKNIDPFDSLKFMSSYLSSIKSQNDNGWWVAQPLEQSDSIMIFKIGDNFSDDLYFEISPFKFQEFSSSSGTSAFSPDGSKYALFNPYDNLLLYDFDRVHGELSNPTMLNIVDVEPPEIVFSSVEWSSDSRFIYLAITDELWQVDTWEENLEDGLTRIARWNGVNDPFETTFVLMSLAPDCKIYMTSGSGTNTYHVINEPNKKGIECDFVQQGIRLPYVSATATLPNFPRFRVDDDEKCDPGITSVFGDLVFYRRDLNVYPNPFVGNLTIELPENKSGQIVVFDMQGQVAWKGEHDKFRNQVNLNLSHLESGAYSVEFLPEDNKERLIYTSQIVKLE